MGLEQRVSVGCGQRRGFAGSARLKRPEAATARSAENVGVEGQTSNEERVESKGGGVVGECVRDVEDAGFKGQSGRLDELDTAKTTGRDASDGTGVGVVAEDTVDTATENVAEMTDSPRSDNTIASDPQNAPDASPFAKSLKQSTDNSHDASLSTPTPQQIRAEGRLQRKHRRLAEGIYRPTANGRGDEDVPGDPEAQEVDSRLGVLSMIESMEGPKIAKRQPGQPKKPIEEGKTKGKPSKTDKDKTPEKTEDPPRHKKEQWQVQKAALEQKFKNAPWNPNKRLSPDTFGGIRSLHASDPVTYSTAVLAEQFEVSPENIRRILRSKWRPREDEEVDRRERWERRGIRKWEGLVEKGVKPPKKWRQLGVGSLKGRPEEKPVWKKGGRGREKFDVGENLGGERGFGDRLL